MNDKIMCYNYLKNKIESYRSILNEESILYLFDLIDLNTSCLNDNKKSLYLKELSIFKDIVLYNLYHSSFSLIDSSIDYTDEKNILNFHIKQFPILIFDYNNIPTLNLFNGFGIDSFEDRREYLRNKLERTKSYLLMEQSKENPYAQSTNSGVYNSSYAWQMKQNDIIKRLKNEIERLSSITDDDIKNEIYYNQLVIESRNITLNNFYSAVENIDFTDDFDRFGKSIKIKKLGFANVVIQDNDTRKSDF